MSLWTDLQYTTKLNIEECQTRLKTEGATVWKMKSLLSRHETGEIGFFWYKKKNLLSKLELGPCLSGSLTPHEQGCQVRADFRSYLRFRWFLMATIPVAFFLLVHDAVTGHWSANWLVAAATLVLISLAQWMVSLLMKPHWRQLTTRLVQAIPIDEII